MLSYLVSHGLELFLVIPYLLLLNLVTFFIFYIIYLFVKGDI